jgi:hypothetical protein
MIPATSRRAIPAAITPHELADAHGALRTMRRRGLMFWVLLLPMTYGAWELIGLGVASILDTILLTMASMGAMVAGRVYWWFRQQGERKAARQVLKRWQQLPSDPRWDAAMVLLDRIAALSTGDPSLQETARRTATVLFVLYEDTSRLKATLPADRVLDGDGEPSERYYRLLAVLRQREAQIETLLSGLRDLHIEMNEQLGNLIAEQPGSVHDRLQELMDRMEADREITRAAGLRGLQVTSLI